MVVVAVVVMPRGGVNVLESKSNKSKPVLTFDYFDYFDFSMTSADTIIQQVTAKISAAAVQGDFDRVTQLTKSAKRVQEIVATQTALNEELVQIGKSVTDVAIENRQRLPVVAGTNLLNSSDEAYEDEFAGDVSVMIDFPKMGINRSATKVSERKVSMTLLKTIELLTNAMGEEILEKLARIRVSRGPLVSSRPERDYLNSKTGALYAHHRIGHSNFHVLTHSSTPEKIEALREVAKALAISPINFQVKQSA